MKLMIINYVLNNIFILIHSVSCCDVIRACLVHVMDVFVKLFNIYFD